MIRDGEERTIFWEEVNPLYAPLLELQKGKPRFGKNAPTTSTRFLKTPGDFLRREVYVYLEKEKEKKA